jgi:hypothetical protein
MVATANRSSKEIPMQPRTRRRFPSILLTLGVLAAAFIVPSTTMAASPTGDTTTVVCTEAGWPTTVEGRPATFKSGGRAGEYLWHNANGWHLRVTKHRPYARVFSGKIVSDTEMTVKSYHLESNDRWRLSEDKKTLTYRFVNRGYIDGLDIKAPCATKLWVRGSMSGLKLPVGRIWLGSTGLHPLTNPFTIERTV